VSAGIDAIDFVGNPCDKANKSRNNGESIQKACDADEDDDQSEDTEFIRKIPDIDEKLMFGIHEKT
jgi:hypothetical protein